MLGTSGWGRSGEVGGAGLYTNPAVTAVGVRLPTAAIHSGPGKKGRMEGAC